MKRLSMFLLGLVFIGLAAFATDFYSLPNYASFSSIEIEGQESMPINITRGQDLKIRGEFTAPFQMNSARFKCYITVMGMTVELAGMQMDLINGEFPVSEGQKLIADITIPFPAAFFTSDDMKLEIMIDDYLFTPVVGAGFNCRVF